MDRQCEQCGHVFQNRRVLGKLRKSIFRLNAEDLNPFELIQNQYGNRDRRMYINQGILNGNRELGNSKAIYNAQTQEWIGVVCGKVCNKHQQKQVVQQINTRHGAREINTIRNGVNRTECGMRTEKEKDIALQRDINYGRIRIIYNEADNPEGRGQYI